jgi:uncharacterized protein with NRDE domain
MNVIFTEEKQKFYYTNNSHSSEALEALQIKIQNDFLESVEGELQHVAEFVTSVLKDNFL